MKRWFLPQRHECVARFTAVDPHYTIQAQPVRAQFTLDTYKPKIWKASSDVVLYGLRSDRDHIPRMLPWVLVDLWKEGVIALETLPEILYWLEPSLTKKDFQPAQKSFHLQRKEQFLKQFGLCP